MPRNAAAARIPERPGPGAITWLLAGDPSIRWQALRDVVDAPEAAWQTERRLVALQGWGKALLDHQGPDGRWAAGLYTPKWTSTHYTLLLLRSMGLGPGNPGAHRAAVLLLEGGIQPDGGIRYTAAGARGSPYSETCETGMALAICAYFAAEQQSLTSLVDHLLRVQLPDGGWNCQWTSGSTHGSLHTTISVLEGLQEFALHNARQRPVVEEAAAKGREFLLQHRLFRSHRTGDIINPAITRFSFPTHWHYDVLRALDHFQSVGAPRDERLSDAIRLLQSRRRTDGRWPLQNRHHGRLWFEMEQPRQPGRWNTLRALRVLRWWQTS